MKINSPLTGLCDTLETSERTALQHKSLLISNENATRAALIDPVLHALGWNTGNVAMVVLEKSMPNGVNLIRADYALYGRNGQVVAVIEAKPLGANLQQSAHQILSYAVASHVTSVFLTNGLIWQHFITDNLNTAHIAPQATYDISQQALPDMAVYLIQHLDAAHFWPEEQTVDALSQDLDQLRSELATLQQQVQMLTAKKTAQPTLLPTKAWTSLASLSNVTKTHPSQYQLPDGTVLAVKYWKDVLVETCKYVLARKADVPVPYADALTGGGQLLRLDSPPDGISYFTIVYEGKTIFIYSNYDAINCVKNANHILGLLSTEQKQVDPGVIYA